MSETLERLYELAKDVGFTDVRFIGGPDVPLPMPTYEFIRVFPNTIRSIKEEVDRQSWLDRRRVEIISAALKSAYDEGFNAGSSRTYKHSFGDSMAFRMLESLKDFP